MQRLKHKYGCTASEVKIVQVAHIPTCFYLKIHRHNRKNGYYASVDFKRKRRNIHIHTVIKVLQDVQILYSGIQGGIHLSQESPIKSRCELT